ncbi:hypothetical protein NIES2100_77560 [Calothrix sp. NIES-2100]|nr:hypothetical protein NIES2100_77560 [Calothrix sp. NIES-2100]
MRGDKGDKEDKGDEGDKGDKENCELCPMPNAQYPIPHFQNIVFDILPTLQGWGFWGQTAIAGTARLTSPSPMVDAPTI